MHHCQDCIAPMSISINVGDVRGVAREPAGDAVEVFRAGPDTGSNRKFHCRISNWVSVHLGPAPANRRFLAEAVEKASLRNSERLNLAFVALVCAVLRRFLPKSQKNRAYANRVLSFYTASASLRRSSNRNHGIEAAARSHKG